MKDYNFKRSDVLKGVLICPEKHLIDVKRRFETFNQQVYELY